MRPVAFLIAASLLAACTSNPVPEGYNGPLARISDSAIPLGRTGADFFYLSKIDGRTIDDSVAATNRANSGRGLQMAPLVIARAVPAQPSTFTIIGQRHYAAPILELTHAVYQLSGDVEFTPEPDRSYVVKGLLGAKYSGVWIEDSETGETVSKRVEIQGSAKVSIFGK